MVLPNWDEGVVYNNNLCKYRNILSIDFGAEPRAIISWEHPATIGQMLGASCVRWRALKLQSSHVSSKRIPHLMSLFPFIKVLG
jgi:hypothetical protein